MTAGGGPAAEQPGSGPPVLVVADDLIWATRLEGQLRTLGARPLRLPSGDAIAAALGPGGVAVGPDGAAFAVVDLTGRSYDALAAIAAASAAGLRVFCVGQHDDPALRAAARAAGAEQVHAYRTLFEHGHAVLAGWLGVPVPEPGSLSIPGRR